MHSSSACSFTCHSSQPPKQLNHSCWAASSSPSPLSVPKIYCHVRVPVMDNALLGGSLLTACDPPPKHPKHEKSPPPPPCFLGCWALPPGFSWPGLGGKMPRDPKVTDLGRPSRVRPTISALDSSSSSSSCPGLCELGLRAAGAWPSGCGMGAAGAEAPPSALVICEHRQATNAL